MVIEYDDNAMDIIQKVNTELSKVGLEFVDDEKEYDGIMVYDLKEKI